MRKWSWWSEVNPSGEVFLDFSRGTDSTGLLFLLHQLIDENQVLKPIKVFHNGVASSYYFSALRIVLK